MLIYAKQYHLVYYNEQQINVATQWLAWIFQCINSLNIVQFVGREVNKSHNEKSRKSFCKLERGFELVKQNQFA